MRSGRGCQRQRTRAGWHSPHPRSSRGRASEPDTRSCRAWNRAHRVAARTHRLEGRG
jgi:hypothetical protein